MTSRFRLPWISRAEHEMLIDDLRTIDARLIERANRTLAEASRHLDVMRETAQRAADAAQRAEERAQRAEASRDAAIQATFETLNAARGAIAEAVSIAKVASEAMLGSSGEVDPAPSVAQADRLAAIRLREAGEDGGRR